MNHNWVEAKYVPVDIDVRDDGTIDISTTELAAEIADEEAVYACWRCGEPLTAENHDSDCEGD